MITNKIQEAKEALDKDEIIGLPTETVYGLAGNIYCDQALEKIFRLKKRPFYNPLIVHIKSIDDVFKVAENIPEKAIQLANCFWPGPLTLILNKQSHISPIITADKPTVAVRVPNHPVALELLRNIDYPLAAPSANPFGSISPTTSQHVQDYFGEELSVILEGGSCLNGIESTIIGFENDSPIAYRLGAISIEEIESIVGKVAINNHSESQPTAPGMVSKHYSPKTRLILSENVMEDVENYNKMRIGVISLYQGMNHSSVISTEILSPTKNLYEAASKLYAAMHRLDKLKLEIIIAEVLPNHSVGKSINDRLQRAAKEQ
jgi:L-threonylcarbamoyladenylate synthase